MDEIPVEQRAFLDWFKTIDPRGSRDCGNAYGHWTVNCNRPVDDAVLPQIIERIDVLGPVRLMLYKSSVTDESVRGIWSLPGLVGVALGRHVTDRGTEGMELASSCSQLYFEKSKITATTIERAIHLPELRQASFLCKTVTDKAVAGLAQLRSVEVLNIAHSGVTLAGARTILESLPRLKEISVSKHKASDDDVQSVKADFPHVLFYIYR